jgi:hypothetical protein
MVLQNGQAAATTPYALAFFFPQKRESSARAATEASFAGTRGLDDFTWQVPRLDMSRTGHANPETREAIYTARESRRPIAEGAANAWDSSGCDDLRKERRDAANYPLDTGSSFFYYVV